MTGASHTDPLLLRRVAAGDEGAFRELFNAYWPQVYGTSLHLTRSPEQAKDLAQDIFVKLWLNREKLSGVENVEGYIYTVSRNLVMDHLRKKVFDTANIDFLVSYFSDKSASPQEKLEYGELERSLHKAIDTLPGKVKDVFTLSRFEGLTHEQIAKRLGISVVSSKTYIVRALQQIREQLSKQPDATLLLLVLLLAAIPD